MIKPITYKAAKQVATVIESHFIQEIKQASNEEEKISIQTPSAGLIETILDAAFWASLRKEEGHSSKLSIAYLSPNEVENPLLFENKLPLLPSVLTKIAPGFEGTGVHLGVWNDDKGFFIWGATHKIPRFTLVINVPEPGLLVIKHRRFDEYGKFVNIAVLNGDEIKIIDEQSELLPDCPPLLTSFLGYLQRSEASTKSINVWVQIAVAMRAHGRGGTLIIVPSSSNTWKNSIAYPIKYSIKPLFRGLAELVDQEKKSGNSLPTALTREIDAIAGLTSIDGAVIMNDKYEVLAFGVKIMRRQGSELIEQMIVTEPIVGGEGFITQPVISGGTRHLSASQFVHDQKDSVVLVASQDGRFTIFSWSSKADMVQAHRIDVLLL